MAFRGLQAESAAQGAAHRTISNELTALVADPFESWAKGYRERISAQRALLLVSWIKAYEVAKVDVCVFAGTNALGGALIMGVC